MEGGDQRLVYTTSASRGVQYVNGDSDMMVAGKQSLITVTVVKQSLLTVTVGKQSLEEH